MTENEVLQGDCVEVMATLPPESVDAIVTDPPYGLEFMGKEWDRFATGRAAACARGGDLITAEEIAKRRGKGGAGPSYVSRPAKRCANCGVDKCIDGRGGWCVPSTPSDPGG